MIRLFGIKYRIKKFILILLVFTFLVSLSSAFPVPYSISGYVLDEDGVAQIPAFVSVENLNNSFYLETSTGIGKEVGKYSFAIKGQEGDIIQVKAWNEKYFNFLEFPLQGIMRNVNLRLHSNLSYEMKLTDLKNLEIKNLNPSFRNVDSLKPELSFVFSRQTNDPEIIKSFNLNKENKFEQFNKIHLKKILLNNKKQDLLTNNSQYHIRLLFLGGVISVLLIIAFNCLTKKKRTKIGKKEV